MSTRAIATSTLWQMASQITMAALGIVTIKLVTLGLSKELVGEYNSAYGYLQIFGIIADFGLYAVSVRELARVNEEKKQEMFGTLLVLRCIILMISLGLALAIAWSVPAWHETHLQLGITIAAFVPFFTLLAGVIRTIFQVRYKLQYVFVAEVGQRIITVGLTALLIYWGTRDSTDVTDYYLMLAFGGAGAAFLFVFSFIAGSTLLRIRPSWNKELLMKTLTLAAPYGLAFLCTALYRQFDVTMIALLRPDFELQNAYYGPVQRMMDMAYVIPTFLLNSTLPIVSERHSKGEDTSRLLGKTLLIILLVGTIGGLFAALWARPLVQLLTRDSYLSTIDAPGSDTALRLLAIPIFMNGLIQFGFYSLLTRHIWKPLVATLALGAALSLILNVMLVPQFGFVGAALTSIVVHAVLAVALFFQSQRHLPATLTRDTVLRWHAFGVVVAVLLAISGQFLTSSILTAAALVIAMPVIGGLAWATGLWKAVKG